jgi:hypothetical protein
MADDPRWQRLADAGARAQRLLWASTGVKNPAYPDTRYVTELVAPGVVNTMPQATLDGGGRSWRDPRQQHYRHLRGRPSGAE